MNENLILINSEIENHKLDDLKEMRYQLDYFLGLYKREIFSNKFEEAKLTLDIIVNLKIYIKNEIASF